MTKVTHTHRGHCQMCLRVHAIDVGTGLLAKHGYVVDGGMFKGECPGSGVLSLHVERTHTDAVITMYRKRQLEATTVADAMEAGEAHPSMVWLSDRRYAEFFSGVYHKKDHTDARGRVRQLDEPTMIPWSTANKLEQKRQLEETVMRLRSEARHDKSTADTMVKWAADIFDKKTPAYPNEALDTGEWKVGDKVRIGGKKGFDTVIEAIEDRKYTTRGFRQGSQTIMTPHGRVTHAAHTVKKYDYDKGCNVNVPVEAHTYWEPLRNIKRPKVALLETLKAAGLI